MMHYLRRPSAFMATASLLVSLMAPANAAEMSAGTTVQTDDMKMMTDAVNARFGKFELDLATEAAQRLAADNLMKTDLNTAVGTMTTRLNTVRDTLNALDARFDAIKTQMRTDIDATAASIARLRADLNGNVNYLYSRINDSYGYINGTVNNLQGQLNSQQAQVADLYNRANTINNQLTSLESFANAINAQIEAMAACVANGSCINRRALNVQRAEFNVGSAEGTSTEWRARTACFLWNCWDEWYQVTIYGVKDTGLTYPDWPYCAITGAENQDVRDFSIMLQGNHWMLTNEPIATSSGGGGKIGWGGGGTTTNGETSANQQNGNVQGMCIRFY